MNVAIGSTTAKWDMLEVIRQVDPTRNFLTMNRRLMKLGEEFGEALQAYLAVTSGNNYKGLTPTDLREELIDIVVVALDLLCYRVPGEAALTDEQFDNAIRTIFERKIEKWKRVRQAEDDADLQTVPEHIEWDFPNGMEGLPNSFESKFEIRTVRELKDQVHRDYEIYQMCTEFGYVQ
jgi:hypothetical protein